MKRKIYIPVLAAALMLALAGCHKKDSAHQGAPPPPVVSVAKPELRDLVEWDEYTGRLEAKEFVELRPRVSGIVKSVEFVEGKDVKEGDLLFTIDDDQYQAAAAGARAEYERAQNHEAQTKNERDRAKGLVATKAISAEDFDTREKAYIEAQAAVRAAKATLDSAELNVKYTKVTSPIDGRISRAWITKGNFVTAGNTMLTSVVSTSPVYLYVDVDEAAALKYQRLFCDGTKSDLSKIKIPCTMQLGSEKVWSHQGEIDFMDNRVDPTTGTLRVRAVFKDIEGPALAPGLFARLRVPGSKQAPTLLVPEDVIGSDQSMKFVFVVDDKGIALPRPVKLGPVVDGKRIVREGLTGQENVIVNGQAKTIPGMPVKIEAPDTKKTAAN
jgi:RND family efflux transporter MFP subunit